MRALLLAVLFVASLVSDAVASELVRLSVPSGFEGPTKAAPTSGASVEAYVRRIPGQERGTLLQVNTYEFGPKLTGVPKKELGKGAEIYLMQFLGGVERRRSSFEATKPTRVTLAGLPGARVEWTGTTDGFQMSGVMYCVIVGTTVVTLHTQGFEDSPASDRIDALRAIEAVSFAAR